MSKLGEFTGKKRPFIHGAGGKKRQEQEEGSALRALLSACALW